MNINVSDKLIYLGAGCGIGLVLGVLFAPQSGEETRHNIGDRVDDLSHKVQERVSQSGIGDTAAQTWQSVLDKGKNVASIGRQRLNDSLEAGKRKFNETMESDELGH
jgi:gas vesicle protein